MRKISLYAALNVFFWAITVGEILARLTGWTQLRATVIPLRYFIFVILVLASFVVLVFGITRLTQVIQRRIQDVMMRVVLYVCMVVVTGCSFAYMLLIDWYVVIGTVQDQGLVYIALCIPSVLLASFLCLTRVLFFGQDN